MFNLTNELFGKIKSSLNTIKLKPCYVGIASVCGNTCDNTCTGDCYNTCDNTCKGHGDNGWSPCIVK